MMAAGRSMLLTLMSGGLLYAVAAFGGDYTVPWEQALTPLEIEELRPAIVNGQPTNYEIYKGAVAILPGGSLCTATLIDPEVLLTAGHCVYLYENNQLVMDAVSNPGSITVKNGANVLYGGTTIAKGKTVRKHETWTGNINSYGANVDLAIIYLDRKVTSIDIVPVRDYPDETKGQSAVVVGYGVTSTGGSDSGTHRWGNTTILNMGTLYGKANLFEVGDPSGVCQGDSGGPLLTQQFGRDVVSGVASFVAGGCSATGGGYHTRTLPFRGWIEQAVIDFTGHGFIEEDACGTTDAECADGETKDCHTIDSRFAAGTNADCNQYCSWWDVSVCSPNCGDDLVIPPEVCDGEGIDCLQAGDFLSGTTAPCRNDCTGYDTSSCTATVCGDGVKEGKEFCDTQLTSCETLGDYDKNRYARCLDDCTGFDMNDCINGLIVCGNGTVDPGEECDDGNTVSGDGCSSKCKDEALPDDDPQPDDTTDSSDQSEGSDQSDDTTTDDTVTDDTTTADTEQPDDTASLPECGNGILEEGEECDDGNMIPGDGCSPDCKLPKTSPTPLKRSVASGCSLTLL